MRTTAEVISDAPASWLRDVEGASLSALLARCGQEMSDRLAVTHLDYGESPDGLAVSLTWAELDRRASAVAGALQRLASGGDRVAVLVPQRVDYLVAFLGACRAGLVAVPLFAPDLPGHAERLAGVLADCEPSVVLTVADKLDPVREFLRARELGGPEVVAVDEVPDAAADDWDPVEQRPDELAYLQYTSGSTKAPTGVMITHGNVVANAAQAMSAYEAVAGRTPTVSWLPLFHDMGLMLALAAPLVAGTRSVLIDPVAFIERPVRWLHALSANPGAISAAPNFAYAYCAARVEDTDKVRLRLEHVRALIDGSEPVQAGAIDRFHGAFAECGLQARVHRSSYGLAEATVLVTASPAGAAPRRVHLDREQLAAGRAVPATGEDVSTLVSCGHPVDQLVRIVDQHTEQDLPQDQVGEIWVSGANVGRGYWRRQQESACTFVPATEGAGHWLRTGDLGVIHQDELYVTGRIKDLIIVDGRNHYPQDVEETVEQAHPAVRRHSVAAFAVPTDDGESAVVAVERASRLAEHEVDLDDLRHAVRSAVTGRHGLNVRELVVLAPGEVPRTSSGKISRSAARQHYLTGTLRGSS
ncbi:fatty acyl-AMP ligase [Saccharopolyspora dendranthemae]|uniref:Acyl-CoA synthetase (AMP-forming)/AMP-acid ligase II n=1 Tax=Saccharopolyspora dendranthemae TaxID=1181886 RepID=A0A561U7N4_9PSEU|nr:fatty acyl-AMP ligase [Saccharopolyspora dendranthemae]TWF95369.1 acyl-CoA synthetase (AMP-forming)/AMP-acid ligase II [Saccharopolyspora dendranthemae]